MAELKSVLNCLANPTFEGHDQRVSVETAPLKGSSAMLVLSLFRLLAARVLRQHADQLDLVPRRYQHRQIRRRGTLDRAQQKTIDSGYAGAGDSNHLSNQPMPAVNRLAIWCLPSARPERGERRC